MKKVTAMADTPTPQNVKVLVVDDEPNIVELLTVSLKFQGFDVEAAESGPVSYTHLTLPTKA